MTTPLNNKKGTTLVELMVCLVLLALFGVAAVTLVKPSAEAYISVQQLTRAQNLADALTETIRAYEKNGLADYDITVTVKVTRNEESYAVTRKYRHTGKYQIYYTMDDGTGQWTFDSYQKDGETGYLLFKNAANQEKSVYANGNTTLHMRYHIEDGIDYGCTFTRITSND